MAGRGKRKKKRDSGSRNRRAIAARVALVLLGLALAGLIEVAVRALPLESTRRSAGDPYVGFSEIHPLFAPAGTIDGRTLLRTADNKRRWFNDQQFTRSNPPKTYRIFALGGSTTYGRPYADATSFAGWLRRLLKDAPGDLEFEVINAGGVSYASYRVVNVMRELLDYDPDLFVVYTGHNEFLEARTYGDVSAGREGISGRLRGALERLETYRVLDAVYRRAVEPGGPDDDARSGGHRPSTLTAEVQTVLGRTAGLDLYHRDTTFSRGVYGHFDYNIGRMKRMCREAGVDLLFLEPVDNLKDFSPFKSEESADLPAVDRGRLAEAISRGVSALKAGLSRKGIGRLREAVEIDPRFAAGRFYLGKALLEAGDTAEAAVHLVAAREEDVCPLRARQAIHDILRDHTRGADDPDLIALPGLFASLSPGGLIGEETLIDHIHPYPEGHLRIALELLGWLRDEGIVPAGYAPGGESLRNTFAATLDSLPQEYYSKGLINLAKVLLWARKHRESMNVLFSRWELLEDVAEARYLAGTLLERTGDTDGALEHLQAALALEEGHMPALERLASIYTDMGFPDSAAAVHDKILRSYPDDPDVLVDYGVTLVISGEDDRALRAFRRAVEIDPEHAGARLNLGSIYRNRGNLAAAEEQFRMALAADENRLGAYIDLARLYIERGDTTAARRVAEAGLRRFPGEEALEGLVEE